MSGMEYNRGKLLRVCESSTTIANRVVTQLSPWASSKLEEFLEDPQHYGYAKIDGDMYKIEYEVESGQLEDGFCNLWADEWGRVIEFETYHYNGGGDCIELIADELKQKGV